MLINISKQMYNVILIILYFSIHQLKLKEKCTFIDLIDFLNLTS